MSGVPELAQRVSVIAREAGAAILTVYESDFSVQTKADASPVTAADMAAHRVIVEGLAKLDPV
jgi:3'(2'), 5'-bisphosphate nucleotidase